jgi:hypothetical protein
MQTPTARVGSTDGFYGMGWEVKTINGLPAIAHNGDHGNFHADMTLTSDGWGVVVMMNANSLWAAGRPGGIRTGVLSLLREQQPVPNEGVPGVRAIVLSIMGIVALQIIGMLWSLFSLRRWFGNSQPEGRPRGWLRVGWYVVLPLVVNLFIGFTLTLIVPAILGGSLLAVIFAYPDLGYTMAMSGVVALIWIIRTVLAYFALRGTNEMPGYKYHPIDEHSAA